MLGLGFGWGGVAAWVEMPCYCPSCVVPVSSRHSITSLPTHLLTHLPHTPRPTHMHKHPPQTHQSGIGAELSALAMEDFFDQLDAPVGRVTGAEVPTPYAANLEAMAFPKKEQIIHQVKRTLGRA